MGLLGALEDRVRAIGGGLADDQVDDQDEACWRCGARPCFLEDGQGLCCECLDTITEDEAESLGVVGAR